MRENNEEERFNGEEKERCRENESEERIKNMLREERVKNMLREERVRNMMKDNKEEDWCRDNYNTIQYNIFICSTIIIYYFARTVIRLQNNRNTWEINKLLLPLHKIIIIIIIIMIIIIQYNDNKRLSIR